MSLLVSKETAILGTHRFLRQEFSLAAKLLRQRRVDLSPLVTHTCPWEKVKETFSMATNRRQAMKVQLRLDSK